MDADHPKNGGLIPRRNTVELVGYHCTRLTDTEIRSVRENGLRTLEPSLFEDRVAAARREGLLPTATAERILARNAGSDDNRTGMIWFTFRTGVLQDEDGVARFLSNWGGEALYWGREDDPVDGPTLRSLGTPCIVEARLPAAGIQSYARVEERVMRIFLDARGVRTGYGTDMEGHVKEAVPASRVDAVITFADEAFEALTRARSWRVKLA